MPAPAPIGELEQKKRSIVNAVERAQDEGNIEKASGIVEDAAIVSPALGHASVGLQYELQVTGAILSMGYLVTPSPLDSTFDLTIMDKNDCVIYAELKYYSRPIPATLVSALVRRASKISIPLILISHTELSRAAREIVSSVGAFEVVQWCDENDNGRLTETLRRMFASILSSSRSADKDESI